MAKEKEKPMTTQSKVITGVIVIIAVFLLFSIFSAPTKDTTTQKANVNMILLMDDDSVLGDDNAPVKII